MENIYIIGSGAIGKALAVFLKNEGRNINLIRGSIDNVADKVENITVHTPQATISADIKISTLSSYSSLNGLVILTNKSFGNESLAEKLQPLINQSPIVILQNGLDVEKPFIKQDFPSIYRCVLFATSQEIKSNTLSFKPVSNSLIGIVKDKSSRAKQIADLINTDHFPFTSIEDIQPVIWTKTIINSVFNSICPLLNIDNGIFHRSEKVLELGKGIIRECLTIATAHDIHLSEEVITETLLRISKASDGQLISTLQDLNANRPTEIQTLNFAIYNKAKAVNLAHQVKQTHLLGQLINLKSKLKKNEN